MTHILEGYMVKDFVSICHGLEFKIDHRYLIISQFLEASVLSSDIKFSFFTQNCLFYLSVFLHLHPY